jgi:hypothetical protein
MLRLPVTPHGFRGVGGFDFSRKEVKTPALPKAGRDGYPENLTQKLRIDESQLKDWPIAEMISFEQFSNETSNSS